MEPQARLEEKRSAAHEAAPAAAAANGEYLKLKLKLKPKLKLAGISTQPAPVVVLIVRLCKASGRNRRPSRPTGKPCSR